jgi:membrane-bound metal-dependent hydrolase YbcI (DUF457 family)
MVYYDHAMVGATLAVAVGAQQRHGWPVVVLAALAGMFPDWDAVGAHVSAETYQIGHRVWGHNLFAATLAGMALGGLGWWIHQSAGRRERGATAMEADHVGQWIALSLLILWTHPLLDFLYCGWDHRADWPVGLLWPIVGDRYGRPWMPWSDWGATFVLGAGMLLIVSWARHRRSCAVLSLVVLFGYVAVRGAFLQGGFVAN